MIQQSLEQRLSGLRREGTLRSNPPDRPFWVPEENPLLLAWDMTVQEYGQTIHRAVGLYPQEGCRPTFVQTWPSLEKQGWNVSLIRLLGQAWWQLHPQGRSLCPDKSGYTPDDCAPVVWRTWGVGPVEYPTAQKSGNPLTIAIASLILKPFALIEKQERAGDTRRKDDTQ